MLEKLEKKLLESDRQFIKLYEDFTKQLVSEQQFRMLSTHFEQEKKETTSLSILSSRLIPSSCKRLRGAMSGPAIMEGRLRLVALPSDTVSGYQVKPSKPCRLSGYSSLI